MINEFNIELRQFIELHKSRANFGSSAFYYQIREDEIMDASLVSLRAYGSREHSDVVMVSSGVSFSFEPLPLEIITLPSLTALISLKKKHEVK